MADQSTASKYAPVAGKIPGTTVNLGGHDLVLAPLTLPQLRKFGPMIETLGTKTNVDTMSAFDTTVEEALPLIHASLSRNYPDMTVEDVRPLLDLGNMTAAILAITGGIGAAP